jgi:hypothetical protein
MTATTPFHMRDDSDVEDIDDEATLAGAGADGSGGGTPDPKAKMQKDVAEIAGGLKQLFNRKPRLGNVEVDPNISMLRSAQRAPCGTS